MSVLETLAVTTDMWRGSTPTYTVDMGFSAGGDAVVWTIISLVLSIVGGILIYFLFVKRKMKLSGKFLPWCRKFFNFDAIIIDDILKITYLILALLITLTSFSLIGQSFLAFLLQLVVGNLLLRVFYELTMLLIKIWRDVGDIRERICEQKERDEKKLVKKEKIKEE